MAQPDTIDPSYVLPAGTADAVEAVAALRVERVRAALASEPGSYGWPAFRVNEVELEWRRWSVRRALGATDLPPSPVQLFDRLAQEDGVVPPTMAADAGTAADGGETASYSALFPQGPLVTKATARAAWAPPAAGDDAEAPLLASARQRRAYLDRLDRENYWWTIPDIVSAATVDSLVTEAGAYREHASPFYGGSETGWDVSHDVLISPAQSEFVPGGELLCGVHEDPVLRAAVSERMGRPMLPTRCSYLFYEEGSFLGVHTDMPSCEVAIFVALRGTPGPMRAYLDETAEAPQWLDAWVHEHGAFPEGGRDFCYGDKEGFAMLGRAIPHGRLPHPGPGEVLVSCLFYSGL